MFRKVLIALLFCVLFLSGQHISEASTIYVKNNDKGIQDAVNNAVTGDTIVVSEGEYRENIIISKPLIIKSERGFANTVIRALNPEEPVIRISDLSNAAIIGITATDSSVAGIYLNNTSNTELRDNKAVNNRHGILLYSSTGNILTNNNSSSNNLTGIYLEASHNNTLERNEASSNREKGIFLNSSNNNSIINNIANRNKWNGITLWVSNNNRIEKNEVMRNTYSIILSGSNGNVVIDNYTWTNLYIILPIILIYIGIIMFFIQRKIFTLIYIGQ